MKTPATRVVYLTDPPPMVRAADAEASAPGAERAAAGGPLPLPVLSAIGERLAAAGARLQEGGGATVLPDELARLERFGLQLQELAQIVARAQQLRRENVDLGLALLQTVAEWSGEADRLGVELHGPAASEAVQANPAALKHLLDLMVEHTLQQGRVVRLAIELPAEGGGVRLVASVSSEPASQSPQRDTLAWQLLQWFAAALGLVAQREVVPRGERVGVLLPRA
ncbi:MAG: hypothetical protein KIT17_04330 [Rubrivivax sp.]|nr:hypothetical protein [Rubrivivax sp.]